MSNSYNFKESESEILKFWEDQDIYKKIKHKNHGAPKEKRFYFLQGPPYTSGRLHVGHAWNHGLKDMVMRYKRMNGFDVWDRGGYDMHGLPTENKVQAKHNLKFKKNIVEFGVDKFIRECIKFSQENAELMSQDLWKMGVWMNHENAYMPIHNSFIEGEWFLIKKAHEKNRLYKGNRVMTWCKSCETALSKHELEYKNVRDTSIFVKFKVHGKDNEYIIIWTTTPWTIPFNLAVMVNPELDYVKAKVHVDETHEGKAESKTETWIVASALAGVFIGGAAGKKFEVLETFKGDKLLGLSYDHPFNKDSHMHAIYSDLKKHQKNVHTVILSEEFVDTTAGTGIVHCAPGCGPEDFEVAKKFNIAGYNVVDELGVFPDQTGRFSGLTAKTDDRLFIDILREYGALVEQTYVDHEYAHCNRCHNPIIFRLTEQWFFKVEDLKDKMIEYNDGSSWYPDSGYNAFNSWLKNLRDNSITKQRFWGTPVPVWVCTNNHCNKYEVVGSIKELKEKATDPKHVPENLHKPWIDSVKLNCSCGHEMNRIPDVLDVWIDAGSASWNCLDYPHQTELFDKYFPADFIVEGKDQIRGWFNLLMVASVLAFDKPAFRSVVMHGFLTDVDGQKMSKSLGNVISPYEIIDKHGSDTLRYYMTGTTAGEDIRFSWDEVALKYKNLLILWNLHNFLIDFQSNNNIRLVPNPVLDDEERYMLSRLHSTIKDVTESMEKYHLDVIPEKIESLYMDLSRVYIQLVREKSTIGSEQEKEAVLYTIYHTLFETVKMLSIICPFITEKIYLNLKNTTEFNLIKESIHDFDWPKADERYIDSDLIQSMATIQDVMQSILACRDRINTGVRWPLSEVIIDTSDKEVSHAVDLLKNLVSRQVNVKNISFKSLDVDVKIKPNFKTIGKDFGANTSKIIGLINTHTDKIALHMKDNKPYTIEGFEITNNHVIVEKISPPEYIMADVRGGQVYLNKTITPELESEGYAREISRRIQQLRKDSKLNKKDSIELVVITELDVSKFSDMIQEKCGASRIHFGAVHNVNKFEAEVTEDIKGKKVHIMFNKV
ncbi:MAG TPA: isoleucine--tRNA ligase [Alphaproteobacteria bacterium]|nr:isoleucine--tRNA ligase [Alphaproteobacteria bacterium]